MTSVADSTMVQHLQPENESRLEKLTRAMAPTIYCPEPDVLQCIGDSHPREQHR